MQLRTIAFVLSIVGTFYSGFATALGLGEITLKSQFNQPLNAEIQLLKTRDLSKEEILPGLASREDFKLVGVDRLFFLSGFDFEVVFNDLTNPIIKVTSSKPITEPYLNFLVEVQWPSGRLLREYTLLLDLPMFEEAGTSAPVNLPSGAPVAAPVQVTAAPKPVEQKRLIFAPSTNPLASDQVSKITPAPSITTAPKAPKVPKVPTAPTPSLQEDLASGAIQASSDVTSDYKVKSGDTLWEITAAVLASSSASVNQKMVAILQANPDAFVKGNINRLKEGRILRIPTRQEVAGVGFQQAMNAVREQNQVWSDGNKAAQKAVLISAAPTTLAAQAQTPAEGRLTLGSVDSGQSGAKGSGASGSGESLENELAIANDELARSTRQNEDLNSRISELESQIETMESLVAVTNDQLKALEITSKNSIVSDAVTTDVELPNTFAEPTIDRDDTNLEDTESESTIFDDIATKQALFINTAIDLWETKRLLIGGVVLAFLVALLVLLRLRKKPEDAPESFDLESDEESLFDLGETSLDDLFDLDDKTYANDNTFSSEDDFDELVQAQTEDIIAEADIYASLGQEDKAIELLQKEIQQNPDNADARLSLLKIYAKSQNSTSFDDQYAQLLPLGNVYANDQAMTLRKAIENAEPFDTDQYSLKDQGSDYSDEVDNNNMGSNAHNFTASVSKNSTGSSDADFDLDDDVHDPTRTKQNKAFPKPVDRDLSFDHNANDLDDASPVDVSHAVGAPTKLKVNDPSEAVDFSFGHNKVSVSESTDTALRRDSQPETNALDEMALDLDFDVSRQLDDELDETSLDDDLGNGLSIEIDEEDDGDAHNFDFDIPADTRDDLSLSLDDDIGALDLGDDLDDDLGDELDDELDDGVVDQTNATNSEVGADDNLDLDSPPPTHIDMASLDEEIDAMTAGMDTSPMPVDRGPEPTLASLNTNSADDDTVAIAGDELDFYEESDEVSTKLDLAKAYMDMGDREGAEDILNEVMEEGTNSQKLDAKALMENL